MMKNQQRVELLTPVGSYEGLIGAINAGADAVYLGGERFGARAYAKNLGNEELIEGLMLAHIFGVKVYLTINTLFKEKEVDELLEFLTPLVQNGLDGVIVQDLGIIYLLHRSFPTLAIHASTQLSVCTSAAARLLMNNGVVRIVPARELTLEEIRLLKATGVMVECFIHGAMCYSYSGKCLFSSILGGRSGNRGRCAQPCRLPYSIKGSKEQVYPLSMKDMCTIRLIPELIEAGIDSFKIEGRMKRPEYAAGVTSIYRKYIDMYYLKGSIAIEDEDMILLERLYLRSQRSEGYYHRKNGKEMITLDSPAYCETDDALLESLRDRFLKKSPKLSISGQLKFVEGDNITLSYSYKDITASVVGPMVMPAKNAPLNKEALAGRFSKLGDTCFELTEFEIEADNKGFCPVGILNELRRDCIGKLKESIVHG